MFFASFNERYDREVRWVVVCIQGSGSVPDQAEINEKQILVAVDRMRVSVKESNKRSFCALSVAILLVKALYQHMAHSGRGSQALAKRRDLLLSRLMSGQLRVTRAGK